MHLLGSWAIDLNGSGRTIWVQAAAKGSAALRITIRRRPGYAAVMYSALDSAVTCEKASTDEARREEGERSRLRDFLEGRSVYDSARQC